MDWRPGASLERLRARADLLASIRAFFAARDVLEVETPLLCSAGVTDPHIEPLTVDSGQSVRGRRYLQSSPEYAMKRLLAAGSGAIYQLGKAFRDGEAGARHNPEFTLLEWYRPDFDHHQLMAEVAELVHQCLGPLPFSRLSYRQLFLEHLDLDPFLARDDELRRRVAGEVDIGNMTGDRDQWLDLLLSHLIEPRLAGCGMVFVYDYPASQAALARIARMGDVEVGQRFELYVDGVELANGYCELLAAGEQRTRFEADNTRRRQLGREPRPLDERLLAAMAAGLPACAGVALGVDRLLLLASGSRDIREVISFDWQRS